MNQIFRKNFDYHDILLLLLVTITSVFWSALYVLRYRTFGLHTDTGSYEQSIWTTLNGDILHSSLAVSVFSFNSFRGNPSLGLPTSIEPFTFSTIHTNVVAILFSPIYALLPYTETLLITSMVLLSLGAIPLYLISQEKIKNKKISLAIVVSYLLYPGLHAASLADFNYATFAIPALLFTFYFLLKDKWIPYWILIGFMLTIREELSLIVVFLGIYLLFFRKKRIQGLVTISVGIVAFAIIMFVVFPNMPIELFTGNFQKLGNGDGFMGIPKTLITQPHLFIEHFESSNVGIYLTALFFHTGFLSFLSPSALLISLPELLKNMFVDKDIPYRIFWNHYQLLIIPGIFISTIFSVQKITSRIKQKKFLLLFAILIISFALISNSIISVAPLKKVDLVMENGELQFKERFVWWEFLNYSCCFDYSTNNPQYFYYQDQLNSANKAISMIPDGTSVSSQDEFVNHLSKRSELYHFPLMYDSVDYILVMEHDGGMFSSGFLPREIQDQYILLLKNDEKHEILLQENGLILFKKIIS